MDPATVLSTHKPSLEPYEALYKTLHEHPGLSLQEYLAAETAASVVNSIRFMYGLPPRGRAATTTPGIFAKQFIFSYLPSS